MYPRQQGCERIEVTRGIPSVALPSSIGYPQTFGYRMAQYLGSCLCGGIRFEILGEIQHILNCHCSDCRKAHGAAFRTRGAVDPRSLQFLSGEELLTRYEHKKGEFRSFCRVCGSNIATFFSDPSIPTGLAIAALDSELDEGPSMHVFVSDKAKWFSICDDLPQFPELPPENYEA